MHPVLYKESFSHVAYMNTWGNEVMVKSNGYFIVHMMYVLLFRPHNEATFFACGTDRVASVSI